MARKSVLTHSHCIAQLVYCPDAAFLFIPVQNESQQSLHRLDQQRDSHRLRDTEARLHESQRQNDALVSRLGDALECLEKYRSSNGQLNDELRRQQEQLQRAAERLSSMKLKSDEAKQ